MQDGALPAPERLKGVMWRPWAWFAREDNVRRTLQQVYSHKCALLGRTCPHRAGRSQSLQCLPPACMGAVHAAPKAPAGPCSSVVLPVTAVRAPCRAAADDELVNSIMEAARHPLALDAIASITLSPRSARPFAQLAAAAAAACPACLIYGKEDPWVVPLWGQRQTAICVCAVACGV